MHETLLRQKLKASGYNYDSFKYKNLNYRTQKQDEQHTYKISKKNDLAQKMDNMDTIMGMCTLHMNDI
jgi:hypothetical protein